MKKFAVILAGCGVYDGAEIHEATLTLLAIKKANATYDIFAPDIEQQLVVNHITGKEMAEKRNVLVESARIARGKIKSLEHYKPENYDGLIFPGGFGVAKNLSNFASKGANCIVIPEVESAIRKTNALGKPIGALCISPVIIAKVLGKVDVTVGQDDATAKKLVKMGANHISTFPTDVIIDKTKKIVSNPCYMLDSNILQIAEGAENVVKAMIDLM